MFLPPENLRRRVQVPDMPPGKTEQHHYDEAHLPTIMVRWKKSGVIPNMAAQAAQYGDFTNVMGFEEAHLKVAQARSMFEHLPPHVRDEFDNDVAIFLDEAQDPACADHLESLGFDVEYLRAQAQPVPENPQPSPEAPETPVSDSEPTPP